MNIVKVVISENLQSELFQNLKAGPNETEVQYDLVAETRHGDSTIIVAIVAGISSVSGILLPSILKFLDSKHDRDGLEIYVKGEDGWEIKVPRNVSAEEIKKIEKIRKLIENKNVREIEIR